MPASKRKKMPRVLDSDDSSDAESVKSVARKLPSSEQAAAWKIDRLKASLQPASEASPQKQSKDAHKKPDDERSKDQVKPVNKLPVSVSATNATSSLSSSGNQQPSTAVATVQEARKKSAQGDEELKEKRDQLRKEDERHAREKQNKKLSSVETASKTAETLAEDRSRKDTSEKLKHSEEGGSKSTEKGNKSGAKLQRPSYVIPKLKKPADSTLGSSAILSDTWSDMRKRGAELEKNRPKQTLPNSAGMRRIPKIVPKAGLCGKADVGVLDKIEQHPGFLRWQQATASQKSASKTEDERNSATAKNRNDASPRQHTSTPIGQQILPTTDIKPFLSPLLSASETSQPSTVTVTPVSALPLTSTKSFLSTPVKSTLLSTPLSAPKKVLLPTPAAPIPVLVRRGAAGSSHSRYSSSPGDEGHFVPAETAKRPG